MAQSIGIKDVREMLDDAGHAFNDLPVGCKIYGMVRPLTFEERLALSYYSAAVLLLRRQGLLAEGEDAFLHVALEFADSDPEVGDEADGVTKQKTP